MTETKRETFMHWPIRRVQASSRPMAALRVLPRAAAIFGQPNEIITTYRARELLPLDFVRSWFLGIKKNISPRPTHTPTFLPLSLALSLARTIKGKEFR